MYNMEIEYQTQTKYLGVIFDSKLSFRQHINDKFNKTKKLLFATKSAMGKFWGPRPDMTKWIYTNIVRPVFTYGCIAWAKTTRTKDFLNRAKRLQRLALGDIGPIRTHSPTTGLEIFTNTMPLDIYIRGEFIAAHNRIKNIITTIAGTSDTISSHYAWARKLRDEAGLHNIPSDFTSPHFHGQKQYICRDGQYNTLNETNPNKLQVFTDGSRMINQKIGYAGCGYVIYGNQSAETKTGTNILHEQSTYLGTMATVFQAEIYAIGQAAFHVNRHPELLKNIQQVDFITDSKSALHTLNSTSTASKLINDCIIALDKLSSKTKVTINWIKAHVGHEGNERADILAKEGTTKINYNAEPIIPVPRSWIKGKINAYITKEWISRWKGTNEARQTKIFFPEPNAKNSKKLLRYDRTTCAKLFRWISGHSFHRYHNHITNPNKYPNPLCRACNTEREETSHLFAYCNGLTPIRIRICGAAILPENFTWTPTTLLAMINEIEKICPEEGTVVQMNDPDLRTDTQNHDGDGMTN
jgi:ribonuclease HI